MNKNAVSGIFALVVTIIVYLTTGNFLITLSAFLFSLTLGIALRPFYAHLFERKQKDPTSTTVVREQGFENGAPEERVLYVLLLTQDIMLDVANPAHKAILEDIFEKSAASLTENYDFFRSRYATVLDRGMPVKICNGTCTDKPSSMRSCYRDWQRIVHIDNTMFPGKENIDLFFHDQRFTDPDGIERNAVTAVQFYRW